MTKTSFTRRVFLHSAAATLAVPALVRAEPAVVRSNISSFVSQNWQDHFDSLGKGAIVCDTASRALHYWTHSAIFCLLVTALAWLCMGWIQQLA